MLLMVAVIVILKWWGNSGVGSPNDGDVYVCRFVTRAISPHRSSVKN